MRLWEAVMDLMAVFTLIDLDRSLLHTDIDVEIQQERVQGGWLKTVRIR